MNYKVYAVKEIKNTKFPKESQDEFIGGDMELIWQGNVKYKCYYYAMKKSKELFMDGYKIHEIMLEEFEDMERTRQWYFKKGRMTFTMQES